MRENGNILQKVAVVCVYREIEVDEMSKIDKSVA